MFSMEAQEILSDWIRMSDKHLCVLKSNGSTSTGTSRIANLLDGQVLVTNNNNTVKRTYLASNCFVRRAESAQTSRWESESRRSSFRFTNPLKASKLRMYNCMKSTGRFIFLRGCEQEENGGGQGAWLMETLTFVFFFRSSASLCLFQWALCTYRGKGAPSRSSCVLLETKRTAFFLVCSVSDEPSLKL